MPSTVDKYQCGFSGTHDLRTRGLKVREHQAKEGKTIGYVQQ